MDFRPPPFRPFDEEILHPMTFAIVAANSDQIVQVSDRRLTGWGVGNIITEASGKAGHLLCDDASALYCYTGLATAAGGYETSAWLSETLRLASQRDGRFRELIEHFADIASEQFSSDPLLTRVPLRHRRLTVMLTAYDAHGQILQALISNFQNFTSGENSSEARERFTVYCEKNSVPLSENPTIIQAIGAFSALKEEDVVELRELLEKRAPRHAIRDKAAHIVTEISGRHQASGTVGRRLNLGTVLRSSPTAAIAGYETDVAENAFHTLDLVDARSAGTGLQVRNITFTAAQGPIAIPVVHRNAPCPCGSGKKYRACHRPKRW